MSESLTPSSAALSEPTLGGIDSGSVASTPNSTAWQLTGHVEQIISKANPPTRGSGVWDHVSKVNTIGGHPQTLISRDLLDPNSKCFFLKVLKVLL